MYYVHKQRSQEQKWTHLKTEGCLQPLGQQLACVGTCYKIAAAFGSPTLARGVQLKACMHGIPARGRCQKQFCDLYY